jgi:BolA family transcriptional regulator, general stress-responsive regulator
MGAVGDAHKMTQCSNAADWNGFRLDGRMSCQSTISLQLIRSREGGVMSTREAAIRAKLIEAFEPTRLDVINESELHAGHRGSPGTGESHFRVLIVSRMFAGQSRVERHRRVNEVLAAELKGGVHALALKTLAPGEKVR